MDLAREPAGVLLVDRLPRDAERLGDLREGPASGYSPSDRGILHSVSEATKRPDRRQRVGGIFRKGGRSSKHVSTIVDMTLPVNPG